MDYPVFTQICRELCVKKTDGLYPVTLEDTCQLVRGQRDMNNITVQGSVFFLYRGYADPQKTEFGN